MKIFGGHSPHASTPPILYKAFQEAFNLFLNNQNRSKQLRVLRVQRNSVKKIRGSPRLIFPERFFYKACNSSDAKALQDQVKYARRCHVSVPTRRSRMASLQHNFQFLGHMYFGRYEPPEPINTSINVRKFSPYTKVQIAAISTTKNGVNCRGHDHHSNVPQFVLQSPGLVRPETTSNVFKSPKSVKAFSSYMSEDKH